MGWVTGAAGRVEGGLEVVGWAAAETARAGADWVAAGTVAMEAVVGWVTGTVGREAEGEVGTSSAAVGEGRVLVAAGTARVATGEGRALVAARAVTGGAADLRSCTQARKARGGGGDGSKSNPRARVASYPVVALSHQLSHALTCN